MGQKRRAERKSKVSSKKRRGKELFKQPASDAGIENFYLKEEDTNFQESDVSDAEEQTTTYQTLLSSFNIKKDEAAESDDELENDLDEAESNDIVEQSEGESDIDIEPGSSDGEESEATGTDDEGTGIEQTGSGSEEMGSGSELETDPGSDWDDPLAGENSSHLTRIPEDKSAKMQQKSNKQNLKKKLLQGKNLLVEQVNFQPASESDDPWELHFCRDIDDTLAENSLELKTWRKANLTLDIGCGLHSVPKGKSPCKVKTSVRNLEKLHIRGRFVESMEQTCADILDGQKDMTSEQYDLLNILLTHKDILYTQQTHLNRTQHRFVYTLHALNHVMKSRLQLVANSHALKSKTADTNINVDNFRDQGLTRPRVLIVAPFRHACLEIVNILCSFMCTNTSKVTVLNQQKFLSEYGTDSQTASYPKKPEDYQSMFSDVNSDDHFRLGISISRNLVKLYTDFYASDIIIASPLGMRMATGAEGDGHFDTDFMSSVEMLILDHSEVFLMQNWLHLETIISNVNKQPKKSHDVDFSRVRMWNINGWSKIYRQTLIFSGFAFPQLSYIFNKQCFNYRGKLTLSLPAADIQGTIAQVIVQIPQVFQRFPVPSIQTASECRLKYFIHQVLPQYTEETMRKTLIFVPWYTDFVHIRNYLKKTNSLNIGLMSEYHSPVKLSKIRASFYKNELQAVLYTERLHFFNRFEVRGIRHILFYEVPHFPHFYSEICNMIHNNAGRVSRQHNTCTILYNKYDAPKVANIIGVERTTAMLKSPKDTHMLVTGDT